MNVELVKQSCRHPPARYYCGEYPCMFEDWRHVWVGCCACGEVVFEEPCEFGCTDRELIGG